MAKKTCEIWLVIDADGDYAVGADRDEAVENFENQIGSAAGARIVKINAKITPPAVEETEADISDEAGEKVEAESEAA